MARGSSVRGGGKLRRALRRFPEKIRKEMGDFLEKSGQELASDITTAAPKDKGDMARAARYKVANDKLSVWVGYSAKRAGFKRSWKKGGFKALWQEFGAKQHKAQPFIRPSFKAKVPRMKKEMRRILDRMIRRARNL